MTEYKALFLGAGDKRIETSLLVDGKTDMQAGDLLRVLGHPEVEFPFPERLPSVWIWPQLSAWLDSAGCITCVRFYRLSRLELSGVEVFDNSWRNARRGLARRFPDIVFGRRVCTLPSLGVKLLLKRTAYYNQSVAEVVALSPSDSEIEAERLLLLAEKYLRPHRNKDGLPLRYLRDLPYSLLSPPKSGFAIARDAVEEREWSFALFCFLSSAWEYGEKLSPEETTFVRRLSSSLGCTGVEREAHELVAVKYRNKKRI